MRRVLDQIHQCPSQRGGQVGHRGDVDQRDVECDATDSVVAQLITPSVDDPVEQALIVGAVFAAAHRVGDDPDHLVEGEPLGSLV